MTTMLDKGKTPEEILGIVLDGLDVQVTDQAPASFQCDCSKARVERALISIGRKELQDMIDEGKVVEVGCQFCGKQYQFNTEELRALHAKATRDQSFLTLAFSRQLLIASKRTNVVYLALGSSSTSSTD